MAGRKKIDIPFDVPLTIFVDDSFSAFKYSSFSKGYHVYKERSQTTVGDDSLHCEEEKDNEYDKHAVAIIYDSFHSNKIVGHVPLYWRKSANNFLKFPNHHICVVVTGKRVNRGFALGLETPVDYFFHGCDRIIGWVKKSIEKLDQYTNLFTKIF